MRPIGFPETSVRNYHYLPRNKPEERRSQLLRGGSLKSCFKMSYFKRIKPQTCVILYLEAEICLGCNYSHFPNNCISYDPASADLGRFHPFIDHEGP